jgi:hypothetical protein
MFAFIIYIIAVIVIAVRQEKEITSIEIGREEIKLCDCR